MRVLFIHQNFPGQFRHAAQALAGRGHDVVALADAANRQSVDGVRIARYRSSAKPVEGLGRAAGQLLNRWQRGEAVARALFELKGRGFVPDVIVGHPGWGELLVAEAILPDTPLIAHAEYYYRADGGDVGFDPEFPDLTEDVRASLAAKNVPLVTALLRAQSAIAPTRWQASRFPSELGAKIRVIHEGIRTDLAVPNRDAVFTHGARTFRAGDEVLTFVNRNLEPMRGFHIFMRALPDILAARPEAHVILVGGDGISYGAPPPGGGSWKARLIEEVGGRLDMARVHFVGQIPFASFLALMQVSRLHVYLTYPFVLSWSMLEAMSAGALVLGSATPPVTEMIDDGRTGLLVEFFDVDGLARRAIEALARPEAFAEIRTRARAQIVETLDLTTSALPAWIAEIERVAQAR